jgi:hypothetical protein
MGVLLSVPAMARQVQLEDPIYPGGQHVLVWSWPSDGEATGFNPDGTAVAANRVDLARRQEARYHLIKYSAVQDRYVRCIGGGRIMDPTAYAWGVTLICNNPAQASIIGSHGPLSAQRGLICWDTSPFAWTDNMFEFSETPETNAVLYGQAGQDQYFGRSDGHSYVGDGLGETAYGKFEGEFLGTEFGTGMFVGYRLGMTAGGCFTGEGVFATALTGEPVPIPGSIRAADVAVMDDRDVYWGIAALIVGLRDDGRAGAWEIDRTGVVNPLRFSGSKMVPESSVLFHALGASPQMGWQYCPKAVSQDGMMIVGNATAPPGTIVTIKGSEHLIEGPVAVYWRVLGVVDGRLWVSEARPLGTPKRFDYAILGMYEGLIKANDVFYDRENDVYVVSGTDQDGAIALATMHRLDLR